MAVISSNRVGFLAIDSSSLGRDGVSAYSLQLKPDIIALQCDSSGATIAQQDIQIYFGAFLGSNRVASSAINFSNVGDFNGQITVSYVNATTDADGVITMTIQAGCELGGKMADALDCTFVIGDDNFLISKVITLAKIIPGPSGGQGKPGKDGLAFVMYCADGDTFDDIHPGNKTLRIYVQDGIEDIGYAWYKRDGAGWINKGSAATLTVTRTDVDGIGDYRCDVSYDTSKPPVSTYMTIKDKLDVYQAEITTVTGPVINSENPFIVAVGNIYKNGELQDTETFSIQSTVLPSIAQTPLQNGSYYHINSINDGFIYQSWNGTSWSNTTRNTSYTYKWFVYSNGDPNTVADTLATGDRKVVAFTPNMVVNNMLIRLEVYKDGAKIAEQSSSFIDMNDPIISAISPESPNPGQLWVNTSVAPPILQIWNGGAWQDVKAANDANNTIFISPPNSKQKDGYLYKKGDIWILANNEQIKRYTGPISNRQDTDTYYANNTILVCIKDKIWIDGGTNIYDDSDWSDINNISELAEAVKQYQQVLKCWSDGLYMFAEDTNGNSEFYSKLTSGELGFYSRPEAASIPSEKSGLSENDQKIVWISTESLCAKQAEIKENIKVTYDDGVEDNHSLFMQIGNFRWQTEPDGSFSLVKITEA
ncbi:MAG: hypothetical protein KBT27_12030 [Prevotellaceae bacterium]|nr:hypothetical protein [Candidatus Faecinaster equi]